MIRAVWRVLTSLSTGVRAGLAFVVAGAAAILVSSALFTAANLLYRVPARREGA